MALANLFFCIHSFVCYVSTPWTTSIHSHNLCSDWSQVNSQKLICICICISVQKQGSNKHACKWTFRNVRAIRRRTMLGPKSGTCIPLLTISRYSNHLPFRRQSTIGATLPKADAFATRISRPFARFFLMKLAKHHKTLSTGARYCIRVQQLPDVALYNHSVEALSNRNTSSLLVSHVFHQRTRICWASKPAYIFILLFFVSLFHPVGMTISNNHWRRELEQSDTALAQWTLLERLRAYWESLLSIVAPPRCIFAFTHLTPDFLFKQRVLRPRQCHSRFAHVPY